MTWETRTTFWHKTREDADYLTHEGPRGSREDNQTPDTGGRASYLKQEEKGQ